MARACLWTAERIVEAIAQWVQTTGRFPRHDDLASARTTSNHDAFFSLQLPSVRTIQKRWSWAELRAVYARLEQTWRAVFRDPWSGEPVEFLDWEDVGYRIPILLVDRWYRRFASLRLDSDDYVLFWEWARSCEHIHAVDTFAGGALLDLTTRRQVVIRAVRDRDEGLYPPRVLAYCVDNEDDWSTAPVVHPLPDRLSRSAMGRVDQRLRALEASVRETHRGEFEELERMRQSFKSDLARWEFGRPEWTDAQDTTRFCLGTCDEELGVGNPSYAYPSFDGDVVYLSDSETCTGVCFSCGGRYLGLKPLRWRADPSDLRRRRKVSLAEGRRW